MRTNRTVRYYQHKAREPFYPKAKAPPETTPHLPMPAQAYQRQRDKPNGPSLRSRSLFGMLAVFAALTHVPSALANPPLVLSNEAKLSDGTVCTFSPEPPGSITCRRSGREASIDLTSDGSMQTGVIPSSTIPIPEGAGGLFCSPQFCVILSPKYFIVALGPEQIFEGREYIGFAGRAGFVSGTFYLIHFPWGLSSPDLQRMTVDSESNLRFTTTTGHGTGQLYLPDQWDWYGHGLPK